MTTAAMRDPITTVRIAKTKFKMLPDYAVPVLAGDLVPGLEAITAFHVTGDDWLAQMVQKAMALTPRFKVLGVGPQLLETGTELDDPDKAKALGDGESRVNRIQRMVTAVKYATEEEVQGMADVVREGGQLLDQGALDGKVPARDLDTFRDKAASQFGGPLRESFGDCFNAEDTPQVLLKEVEQVRILFDLPAATPTTKAAIMAAAPQALSTVATQVDASGAAVQEAWRPVLPTYVTAVSYALNAGFTGEVLFIHVPTKTPPAVTARRVIEEVAQKKFRCSDIVLLNPIRSPAELLTHWAGYFANEPVIQGMVWAGLKYRDLEHLQEIAKGVKLMAGAAAGHFAVIAGKGKVLGYDTPVHAALAGRCRCKDGLLNPDANHYGLLESTFGAHEDKAVYGVEDIDSLGWMDGVLANLANCGINCLTTTDGLTHAFRLRSLSKDVQHSQADVVRGREWLIGTARKYLRRVLPGECNTPAQKRQVAEDVTKLLTAPFTNRAGTCKDGLSIEIEPGESADPREWVAVIRLPSIAFVERITFTVELMGDK
jgi:hypothetical protein